MVGGWCSLLHFGVTRSHLHGYTLPHFFIWNLQRLHGWAKGQIGGRSQNILHYDILEAFYKNLADIIDSNRMSPVLLFSPHPLLTALTTATLLKHDITVCWPTALPTSSGVLHSFLDIFLIFKPFSTRLEVGSWYTQHLWPTVAQG